MDLVPTAPSAIKLAQMVNFAAETDIAREPEPGKEMASALATEAILENYATPAT